MKKTFTKTDLHQKHKTRKISPLAFLQSNLYTTIYTTTRPSGD